MYVQPVNICPYGESLKTVSEEAMLDILRLLEVNQSTSQRQLAMSLRISLGKVNYCLRALVDRGLLKAENYRNSNNKLAYLYLLTPAGMKAKAEFARRFLALKRREFDSLRAEIERLKREAEAGAVDR